MMHHDHETLHHRQVDRRCHRRSLRHSWAYTHSTLEPTRTLSFSPEHIRPSLTAPNNLTPNRETPLNPQNRRPLMYRSPLPRRACKREVKLAHRLQRCGLWNCGNTRSIRVTQKNSTKSVRMATSAYALPTR